MRNAVSPACYESSSHRAAPPWTLWRSVSAGSRGASRACSKAACGWASRTSWRSSPCWRRRPPSSSPGSTASAPRTLPRRGRKASARRWRPTPRSRNPWTAASTRACGWSDPRSPAAGPGKRSGSRSEGRSFGGAGRLLHAGRLLKPEEGGQDLPLHPQGAEDRHRLRQRLPQLVQLSQLPVDLAEVQADHRRLIGEPLLLEALARTKESGLRVPQMPDLPQELPLLPGGAEQDHRILTALIELSRLVKNGESLVGPAEVDITTDEVVMGSKKEVRIRFTVDFGKGSLQDIDRSFAVSGVVQGDSLPNQSFSLLTLGT